MIDYNEIITDFINNSDELEINKCECGAITIHDCVSRGEIAFSEETHQATVPFIKPTTENVWFGCNHCVNDWGIDK